MDAIATIFTLLLVTAGAIAAALGGLLALVLFVAAASLKTMAIAAGVFIVVVIFGFGLIVTGA